MEKKVLVAFLLVGTVLLVGAFLLTGASANTCSGAGICSEEDVTASPLCSVANGDAYADSRIWTGSAGWHTDRAQLEAGGNRQCPVPDSG